MNAPMPTTIGLKVFRPVISANQRLHYYSKHREVTQTKEQTRVALRQYDARRPIALPVEIRFVRVCRRRFDDDRLIGSPTLTAARDTVTRWIAHGQPEPLTDSPAHADRIRFTYGQEPLREGAAEHFRIEIQSASETASVTPFSDQGRPVP
jgi:hypothetical protein